MITNNDFQEAFNKIKDIVGELVDGCYYTVSPRDKKKIQEVINTLFKPVTDKFVERIPVTVDGCEEFLVDYDDLIDMPYGTLINFGNLTVVRVERSYCDWFSVMTSTDFLSPRLYDSLSNAHREGADITVHTPNNEEK